MSEYPITVQDVEITEVTINGVVVPPSDYRIDENSISFISSPAKYSTIQVMYKSEFTFPPPSHWQILLSRFRAWWNK